MREISLSVRDLVEHVYASGDLNLEKNDKKKLQEGTKIHQKVQKSYSSDEVEVFVKTIFEYEDFNISLQGRIDILTIVDDVKKDSTPITYCMEFKESTGAEEFMDILVSGLIK